MATNSTTYYNLPVFAATDQPKWLVDWNTSMEVIDGAIAQAKAAGDNAQTTANANAVAISGLSDSVSTMSTALGTLTTNVTTVTGNVQRINELIGNGTPTTQDKTIIGAINELKAEIDALAPGGAVSAAEVSYDNTSSGLTADDVQEAIDEVEANIKAVDAKVDALPAPVDLNLSSNVVATVTAGTGISNLYGAEVHVLTNADGSIGKIYGYISAYATSVTATAVELVKIAASNIPTIATSYDIIFGAIPMLGSTGNVMKLWLRFNTDNTISVMGQAGGSSSNEALGIALPPCLYILKDLGD